MSYKRIGKTVQREKLEKYLALGLTVKEMSERILLCPDQIYRLLKEFDLRTPSRAGRPRKYEKAKVLDNVEKNMVY